MTSLNDLKGKISIWEVLTMIEHVEKLKEFEEKGADITDIFLLGYASINDIDYEKLKQAWEKQKYNLVYEFQYTETKKDNVYIYNIYNYSLMIMEFQSYRRLTKNEISNEFLKSMTECIPF